MFDWWILLMKCPVSIQVISVSTAPNGHRASTDAVSPEVLDS